MWQLCNVSQSEAKIMMINIQFLATMNSIKLLLCLGEYMIFRELRF